MTVEQVTSQYFAFCFIVFTIELFLTLSHAIVLSHLKTAPKKILVKQVYYFVVDMITPLLSAYILQPSYYYLCFMSVHTILHFYYIATWNKAYHTKKIISWSSLEWVDSVVDSECFPLTCYDMSVHTMNMIMLTALIPFGLVIASVIAAIGILYFVMFVKYGEIWTTRDNISARTRKFMTDDLNF